jgi:hypothetical protein
LRRTKASMSMWRKWFILSSILWIIRELCLCIGISTLTFVPYSWLHVWSY